MVRFVRVLFLVIVSTSVTALAQIDSPAGVSSCGDSLAKFEVKTAAGKSVSQSDAGKALVYFIEDDSNFGSIPKPTTRMGIDGKWIGATHGNSYVYAVVDPGVHHLCASWQRAVLLGRGLQTAAAHFAAESGGVYYFEIKNRFIHGDTEMTLAPLDSDEGRLLVNKFAFATSQLKK